MEVWEQERGGVASALVPPPLLSVAGPKACVRAGGRLAPRGPLNIDATGGRDAYFRERDEKKNIRFHINKIILPDFSRRYS